MGERYYFKKVCWNNGDLELTIVDSRDGAEHEIIYEAWQIIQERTTKNENPDPQEKI